MSSAIRLESCSASDAACGIPIAVRGFTAASMRLLERSDIGCLLISCACDATEVLAELQAATGFEFPRESGPVTRQQLHGVLWLTPRSWLLQCSLDEELQLAGRINAAFADKRVHAALFSDHLCWFELSGAGATALLSEGGFVSLERDGLEVGHAKRTLLAGVAVVMLRSQADTWLLAVERSRARYFAEWLRSVAARSVIVGIEPERQVKPG